MQELTFMKGLVEEIERSKDPRFKTVTEWCLKIAQELSLCGGDAEKQKLHAAVAACDLLVSISDLEGYLSAQQSLLPPTFTVCNEKDMVAVQHWIKIDFDNKTIVVSPAPISVSTLIVTESRQMQKQMSFEPLILPLSDHAQSLLDARKEPA